MEITLPTGHRTTRLGFGCAFPLSVTKGEVLRCLDAAFDAGIRHFDVAPMYVDGAAERYLGDFLKRHDGGVTVTTKYGILPSAMRPLHVRVARRVLSPALQGLRRVPAIASGLSKTASAMKVSSKAAFNVAEAKLSLTRSLQELQLDAVHIFLMHSPDVVDLDDDLLEFLKDCVAMGRVSAFGIGGDACRASDLFHKRRQFCDIMQFDWGVLSPNSDYPGSFRIHFSVFSRQLTAVHQVLLARPEIRKRWSAETDLNLADIGILADVMLKGALTRHPASVVLFRSSEPNNIVRNVSVAEDMRLEKNAVRFCQLIEREGVQIAAHIA